MHDNAKALRSLFYCVCMYRVANRVEIIYLVRSASRDALRQVEIIDLPYTGLTAPSVSDRQFEIIEVAQILQITTFTLAYTWRIFALATDRPSFRLVSYD